MRPESQSSSQLSPTTGLEQVMYLSLQHIPFPDVCYGVRSHIILRLPLNGLSISAAAGH